MARFKVYFALLCSASVASAAEPRTFHCSEPIPAFTLGEASNPTDAQLTELCDCMWSKFPEKGWERKVSAQINAGQDPGWRGQAFLPRFGAAIDECGGQNL